LATEQGTVKHVRKIACVLVVLIFVITVLSALACLSVRQIPFDSQRWRACRIRRNFDLRVRMRDDFFREFENTPALTLQDIATMLGPPDDPPRVSDKGIPVSYSYWMGRRAKLVDLIIPNHYWLSLTFDRDGRLVWWELHGT
jgi:hypothetical protein